jgi:hypothetical protein
MDNEDTNSGGGISEYLPTQHNRGKDFQNLVQIVWYCEGIDRDIEGRPPNPATLTAWLSNSESAFTKAFKADINTMLLGLQSIASDAQYNGGLITLLESKKVFAPIEFVFMGK